MACAFSFDEVMSILRDQIELHYASLKPGQKFKLLTQGELEAALLNQSYLANGLTAYFTTQEAADIAKEYYGTYQKFFKTIGNGRLKGFRRIVRIYSDNGTGQPNQPIPADVSSIVMRQLDQAYLLDGSARERELEKVSDLLNRYLNDGYNTDKITSSIYLLPLLSIRFFASVLTSNLSVVVQRGLISKLSNGMPDPDGEVGSALEFMKANFFDVLKGGVPQKTVNESEKNMRIEARPEEFDFIPTGSKVKDGFLATASFMAKLSARVNNSFDSAGMSYSTETWLYNVIKENIMSGLRAKGIKPTRAIKKQVEQEVFRVMFPNNAVSQAVRATEEMYANAGYVVGDSGLNRSGYINRNSPQFKRSVMDLQRRNWQESEVQYADMVINGRPVKVPVSMPGATLMANRFAAVDFFKQPMQIRRGMSGFEFFDRGIGGILASTFQKTSDLIHTPIRGLAKAIGMPEWYANLMADKATLTAVGYINGANAFIEQVLELSPYGFVKGGMMALTKGQSGDDPLYTALRTKDVFAKAIYGTITAAVFYGVMKAISEFLCGNENYQSNVTNRSARDGKAFVMCGYEIPSWIPGMQGPMVGVINLLMNEESNTTLESITAMINLLGFRYDNPGLVKGAADYMQSKNSFEEGASVRMMMQSGSNTMVQMVVGMLPIPSRLINEGTQLFGIDSQVSPQLSGMPDYLKWSFLSAVGLKEQMMDMSGDNPVYDYRGREVLSSWMKFNVTDGVRYDKIDQYFSSFEFEPKLIYNSRYRTLSVEDESGETVKRFPTAEEYSTSQKVAGVLLNRYLTDNFDYLQSLEKDVARAKIRTLLIDLERYSKMAMEEAETEEYEDYMLNKISSANTDKKRRKAAVDGN